MRGIEGERVLLRIILSESRTHDRQPLFRRLLDLLRAEGLAGTTVLKGVAGFGHDRVLHTVALEVASLGLPIVLEIVDTQEHIDLVLPKIDALMVGGVVMIERAHVIRYTPAPDAGPASWP
jgi:hypothetical protein